MGKPRRRPRLPAPLAQGVDAAAAGMVWRPAKARLEAVGAKDAARIAVHGEVEASLLGVPVVAPAARGGQKQGVAVDALDGAPLAATSTQPQMAAGGVRGGGGAKGVVAVGQMWRPRRPTKGPLEAKDDARGAAVVAAAAVHRGKVEASLLGTPVVAAGGEKSKGTLEEGVDALAPVSTRQDAVGVKGGGAQGVVAVGKIWRPRRPAKAPLEAAAGVKDAAVIAAVHGKVEAPLLGVPVAAAAGGGEEKGSLEDGIAVCQQMDPLHGAATTRREVVGAKDAQGAAVVAAVHGEEGIAVCRMDDPVLVSKRQGAVGVKDAQGVTVGKMWRPRRRVTKEPLEASGVKDAQGAAVITVDGKVEASVIGAPVVVVCSESGPLPVLEEGAMVCQMDALAPPVTARLEAVGVEDAGGVVVGKMRLPRRRRLAKAPLEALGVKDAQGVAVITVDGKAPVVVAARGSEKGPLEEGIMVCQVDALDGALVVAMTQQEALGVKDAGEVAVGKMWQPQQPLKAPLEALGLKDAEGVAVITVDGKAPVVVAARGGEKGTLEEGIAMTHQEVLGVKDAEEVAVGKMWQPQQPSKAPLEVVGLKDAEGVAVIAVDGDVEPLVLGVPVVVAAGGGEKGSPEDGDVVCWMDAFDGAAVITTDEKVQGDLVFPTVDQKVDADAPVVEEVQAITMEGNGKEDKDKDGIKWLKHYSTAQSILIVGDGDLSFSLALATTFGSGGNIVATSLDSYGALMIKYGKAESNVRELKRLGATVLHGVDAQMMKLHSYLEMRQFDRIVFNFPHAGFKGREHWLRVIRAHKLLVLRFLVNARQLLRPNGEIHLSHKTGFPYDAWDIEQLANESCLVMVQKVDFSREDYPGYNQKKGDGVTCDESFPLGPCCTYMFRVGDAQELKQARGNRKKLKQANGNRKKLKQAHRNRVGSISSSLGDSKFYSGISATDMMWPFDLQPAWPQPYFPTFHLPIAFDPCPSGVAEIEHPVNYYGTPFHHQDMVQPTHQEQPWYQINRQLTLSPEDRHMGYVDSSLWQTGTGIQGFTRAEKL